MSTFSGDQLQPEDTLEDIGVDEVLDDAVEPPHEPSTPTAQGTTARDLAEGESLDERLRQEEPDPASEVAEPDVDEVLGDPTQDATVESSDEL
ncbi:MAG: hypothetical protein ACXVWZ_11430 [Nocardioides sp.]